LTELSFLTGQSWNGGGEMKNNRTLIFMIVMINAGGYNEQPVDQDEILLILIICVQKTGER
jgi:hypothetical protein